MNQSEELGHYKEADYRNYSSHGLFFSCKSLCEIKPCTIQSPGGIHDLTLEVIQKNLFIMELMNF